MDVLDNVGETGRLWHFVHLGARYRGQKRQRGLKYQASRQSLVLWSWGESTHRNLSAGSAWAASARGIRDVCLSDKSVSV